MTDRPQPEVLELVAAYLGVTSEELAREWRTASTLGAVAERYGRPRVGLEELVEQTLRQPVPSG